MYQDEFLAAYGRYLDCVAAGGAGGAAGVATFAQWACGTGGWADVFSASGSVAGQIGSRVVRRGLAEAVGGGGSEFATHERVVCADAGGGGVADQGVRPGVSGVAPGKHSVRNRRRRMRDKGKLAENWRRGECSSVGTTPSLAPTVATVATEVDEELEARKTLALRRVAENKVAARLAEHRLLSLQDADKTAALARLELARIQERINTATAKSQASYKKCDSPLDSVGSAGSAGEFAWKQEIRKRDELKRERDYLVKQLDFALKRATPEVLAAVAAIPEPHILTDAEIEAMDEDISPFLSTEEMEKETERYFSRDSIWFD